MTVTRRVLIKTGSAAAIACLFGASARADEGAAFRSIITNQIEAFGRDDGPGAFQFASPGIQERFGSPDRFMEMVRSGYNPVYRHRSYTFGAVTREFAGRPTQRVVFVDQDGRVWTALYAFEQQPDGTWKIAGVTFTRTDEEIS